MTTWIKCTELKPIAEDCGLIANAGGISPTVLVAVKCDNGVKFVSTDEYDQYTNTWVKYTEEAGQHVTRWARLPEYPKEKQQCCPQCNSPNIEKVHFHGSGAIPECDFLECNDCDHQWGHS